MMYHLFHNSIWKVVRIAKTSDCKISWRVFSQGTVIQKENAGKLFLFLSLLLPIKPETSKPLFPPSRLCVHPSVCLCVRRLAPIPAGESQDVTNKSCSICLRDDPWGPWRSRT